MDFQKLRVIEIIRETADAITLVLARIDGEPLVYKAGQFLTLILFINEKELRRSYSFSSVPQIDAHPSITIKRVENGEVSRHLMDTVRTGDVLTCLPPSGRFVYEADTGKSRDVFLIAAGSGVTPIFSLLKFILAKEPKSKITLILSNKNSKTTIFFNSITKLKALYPDQLRVIHVWSNPGDDLKQAPARLNIGLLEVLVNENSHFEKSLAKFYTCGPYEFMRMVRMTLIFMKFKESQIHKENFILHDSAVPAVVPVSNEKKKLELIFGNKTYLLEITNQTILKAASDQGIHLPYSCLGGICSTCAGVCTKGKIRMARNEVLTDSEQAAGWILTCVGYPESEEVTVNMDRQH